MILNGELIDEVRSLVPRLRKIKYLISAGADVNYQHQDNGYSVLMYAVAEEKERVAEYLLKQGANPLIVNSEGNLASNLTPSTSMLYPNIKDYELFYHVLNNNLPSVEQVINEGALVSMQGVSGYTPLMIAAVNGNVEMVEFLICTGADTGLLNDDGFTALKLSKNKIISNMIMEIENFKNSDIRLQLLSSPRMFRVIK